MTFEELEKTRQIYYEKRKKIWTRVGVVVGVIAIFVAISTIVSAKNRLDTMEEISLGTTSSAGLFSVFMSIMMGVVPFVLFAFVVGIIVATLSTRKESSAYTRAYKAYFVSKTLSRYFQNLTYKHDAGLSRETLRSTGMVDTGDRYGSNDFVSGKYKNVNFAQADLHIEEEHTDSDGDTTYATLFYGRWMIFEFPKKFSFRLAISGKSTGSVLALRRRNDDKIHKFKRIKVESPEFNKMFKLYSEDGFETFYLLDPALIEDIQELGEKNNGKIVMLFVDNKLHIGFNNHNDAFEPPSPKKPLDEATETAKVEKDIKVVTDFVNKLNLSSKVFEK